MEVALGEAAYGEIVEDAVDYVDGDGDPNEVRSLAERLAAEAMAAHLTAQASWPSVTDSDRLSAAFDELNAAGIVAREDFTCCQNCGLNEIGAEVDDPSAVRGYAFYHRQDAEGAVESGQLHVAYGRFEAPPTVDIGNEVSEALKRNGLDVYWDGTTNQRILVRMTWQRRREGELATV